MSDQNNLSLLSSVKEFVEKCPFFADIDLHIDQTENTPVNYSIQTSGLTKLTENVFGDQQWQYNAILQSREYTADDISRLNATNFTERLIFWVEEQNKLSKLPELGGNRSAVSISADNGLLLALDDDGDRGIYQVQLHLIFNVYEEDF